MDFKDFYVRAPGLRCKDLINKGSGGGGRLINHHGKIIRVGSDGVRKEMKRNNWIPAFINNGFGMQRIVCNPLFLCHLQLKMKVMDMSP